MTIPLVPDLVGMKDTGTYDIPVFFGVTASQPAGAVGMAKLPAIPGEATDDDVEGTLIRVQYPASCNA